MVKLTDAKRELFNKLKRVEKDSVTVKVRIYNCEEDLFHVDVDYFIDGDYTDGWNLNSFEDESDALKRAKSVHKTVKGWFSYSDVTVVDEIESYHV